ncbi:SUMF1/EgtB/PvdO family nonheme iron enzyme [Polyangium sorediatum]|uniref:SUMF1/EgtB/PvdO family nonheme iron enzyme n=1 Tax=Polyangium sorediatum TaxID=889274 RepID=A0ABT6NVX1_9BACT|nr:SUMF1/EgtB/PvdO family nonheme iron enzyme [Polyangium sorediatum]MDI1432260.1 SUMF1/EgtB/PvdO family nonheme iron enzyme [Polyangium sorediatum]
MRIVSSLPSIVAALVFVAACSAAAPEPVMGGSPPPPPPPAPPPAAAIPTEKPADAAPPDATGKTAEPAPATSAMATPAPTPVPSAEPSACPPDMQLVEGEYCTEVEHKCKKSWFDKSNKKTVCEEFEPTSKCVGKKVKKRYCVDTYEWPNQKGVRPEVMNRFHQAQIKCASVGKRMCTESEWNFACEGPEMKPFPHGYVRDAAKCNGDHLWDDPNMKKVAARDGDELARLWKGVPSGSQPNCISAFGVADMPANTDEVVASEQPKGSRHALYDSVHTGGPWYKGVRNQCRPKVYTHDEDFYYYFLSFRCCAEADGKPTDARTPWQIRDKWTVQKVEKRAGFTIAEMQKKLDQKKQGQCTCAAHDILCKTMCGTLLGPGAVDAKH